MLTRIFFNKVDASSLAVFRMGFGALLMFECINYGLFLCPHCDYHQTAFLFKYGGFEWVHPAPALWLKAIWLGMGICAFCITVGYFYRAAMVLFTIGFVYMFLLDEALYLNHFYMVILFCILMCFIPAHRHWSIDAKREPNKASVMAPNWTRVLLGAQLEIILIHAGLVKITHDWLHLEPMRMWMNARSVDENALLQWLTQDWGIAVAAYGAIALHLIGAPLLLWRKTRLAVVGVYAIFHITNSFVFNIGIFPWFTLFASLLLFDPHWPKQFWAWLRRNSRTVRERFVHQPVSFTPDFWNRSLQGKHWLLVFCISGWLLLQIVIPFRHWMLPGNVAWNEDGHRYSWRMKLRSKRGQATFIVSTADKQWQENPRDYLTPKQARKMTCIPDMLWQFAQFLEAEYASKGMENVEVRVETSCSLNGRARVPLIDSTVDLTAISRYEPVSNWVLPLREPMRSLTLPKSSIPKSSRSITGN